jgi:hypothetical protein
MLLTTAGQVLINEQLPEELRSYSREMTAGNLKQVATTLAKKYPDRYKQIMHRLLKIGEDASLETGGFSFGLDDIRTAEAAKATREQLKRSLAQILNDDSSADSKKQRIAETVDSVRAKLENDIFEELKQNDNPLALQVLSGARGSKQNLRSLVGSDLLYPDHQDNVIPWPVLRSYSEGLSPSEYFAGTFGARKGLVGTKLSTAHAGFFGKQLVQTNHRLVVDDDGQEQEDETRGLPTDTDDNDNIGALLAAKAGNYARNTVITAKVLKELRAAGVKNILVRSPLVGGPKSGGVYSKDVGVRERGGLPVSGDFVGISGAQALAEKVAQGSLGSKHASGGVGAQRKASPFEHLNQLIQVSKSFNGSATHAQTDGHVSSIDVAPQGGFYISINSEKHYVPAGIDLKVKKGDLVEAGDLLSDGVPNPAEVVQHKGVGEGRRYFVEAFRDAFANAGHKANRRNIEIIARGLVNHVQLNREVGDYVPDDIVTYQDIERTWEARPDARDLDASEAYGMYLEKPVLHYSIGTRIRPSVIKTLGNYGIKKVKVHHQPPPFDPIMPRALDNLQYDPDWQTQMLDSYLEKSLLRSAQTGSTSDMSGTSYVPALASGVQFGQHGKTQGWNPNAVKKLDLDI